MTAPAGFSNQVATSCRGSPGAAASDGSAGRADGDGPLQAAAADTGPLMMRGGGKLGSLAFGALSQPVTRSAPSAAAMRARIGVHVTSYARSEEHTSELQSQSNLVCR